MNTGNQVVDVLVFQCRKDTVEVIMEIPQECVTERMLEGASEPGTHRRSREDYAAEADRVRLPASGNG